MEFVSMSEFGDMWLETAWRAACVWLVCGLLSNLLVGQLGCEIEEVTVGKFLFSFQHHKFETEQDENFLGSQHGTPT